MRNRERFYDVTMRLAQPLANVLAPLHPKGAMALRGRRASAASLAAWARASRDSSRPLVHVHAPSVGEALMAQAIVEEVRIQRPDAQIAFTFFSPSTERVAARVGADIHGYLPLDTSSDMRRLVALLKPAAVAFVRTEIWPMLGIEAANAGARVAFVNAVLGADSSRLTGPARYFLGPAYARLHAVGAVAADDAARFAELGVSPNRTFVTGDARFDQVWKRIQTLDPHSALLDRVRGDASHVVVAGSTWEADEALLLEAFVSLRTHGVRLVIAPHEPTEPHIRGLESRIDALGAVGAVGAVGARRVRLSALSGAEAGSAGAAPEIIIVDSLGVLADLYAAADFAYVGGGFGDNGLHSVVEPAALGVPVVYGPRHGNAREAGELAGAGGGFIVSDAHALTAAFARLLNATTRDLAGTAAESFVRSRLGGAEANAAIICGLMKKTAA